jgi:hypothetical protein
MFYAWRVRDRDNAELIHAPPAEVVGEPLAVARSSSSSQRQLAFL